MRGSQAKIGAYGPLTRSPLRIGMSEPKPMNDEQRITAVRERQGWNDSTMLTLALEFIDDQGGMDDFADMLEDQAATENKAAEDLHG